MPLCLSLTGSTTLCISLYLCPALCWQRGKCPSKQRPRRAKDQAVTGPCRHTPKQAQAVENLIQWSMHRPRQATAQASRQAKAQAWSSVGIDADSLLVSVSVRLCLPVCLHIFASLFVWYLGVSLHLSACLSPHYACFASTPLPCSCLCPTALPQSMPLPQSLPVPQYLSLPQSLLPQTLPLPQSLSICKPRSLLPSMRP